MTLLQPMMIAALLLTGMGAAVLGSIKLPLAKRLQIDEARVGGLVSLFGFIMIPVIFTAGFLTDQYGRQVVFMSGSILMALSLGLLACARGYSLALAAVLLLSGGWSLLVNAGNVLVPITFGGSIAYATNMANVFFGLGAFLTPLAAAYLVQRASLPAALLLIGGLALVPAGLALGVDFAGLDRLGQSEEPGAGSSLAALLADPVLWLCGLAMFCYGPLEASMGAWTTTYLGERGVPTATASGLLSGFWLTFMLARLATAFSLPARSEAILLLVLALLGVCVLLGMVLSRKAGSAMILVLAAGWVFGPIFPTLMAILLGHFADAVKGRAVGLMFAIGGIGWTLIPLLIGAYARRTSVQRSFAIAVATAAGLCLVTLLLLLH